MRDTHIDNLKTLKANLRGAIRNRESVTIYGGIFRDDELRSLLLAVEITLANQRKLELDDDGFDRFGNRERQT